MIRPQNHCVVYSFTDSHDTSFELALRTHQPSCNIHVYAAAPGITFAPSSHISVNPWAVSSSGSKLYKGLSTVAKDNMHTEVSLLKLSLRGKEIDELSKMLSEPWLPKIDQIALELYFEDCSISKFRAFHDMIDSQGYVLVWKEIIWQDQPSWKIFVCAYEYLLVNPASGLLAP